MRISCLQAANADPNHSEQEHRNTVPAVPSVPQTRNYYGSDPHYFVTVQNQHHKRLHELFPDINPAALKRILGNHIHM